VNGVPRFMLAIDYESPKTDTKRSKKQTLLCDESGIQNIDHGDFNTPNVRDICVAWQQRQVQK